MAKEIEKFDLGFVVCIRTSAWLFLSFCCWFGFVFFFPLECLNQEHEYLAVYE